MQPTDSSHLLGIVQSAARALLLEESRGFRGLDSLGISDIRVTTASTPPTVERQPHARDEPPSVGDAAPNVTPNLRRDPKLLLKDIRDDYGDCQRCRLGGLRKRLVFGVGDSRAQLMFVGEAPGAEEDRQGIPFVGKAGQLLTKIIQAMGLSRDEVYISNIVKCRPPQNRDPLPDEIENCEPYLIRQIAAIQPKVIVTLGKFAAQCLLRSNLSISRLRGKFTTYQGIALMPTFHPAYLLRNPEKKRDVWDDVQQVMALLERS